MTTFITRDELLEIRYHSENICEEDWMFDYSGRGMYGDTCLGLKMEALTDMFDLGLAVGSAFADGGIRDEVVAALNHGSHDNLGRDYIVYWPHLKVGE